MRRKIHLWLSRGANDSTTNPTLSTNTLHTSRLWSYTLTFIYTHSIMQCAIVDWSCAKSCSTVRRVQDVRTLSSGTMRCGKCTSVSFTQSQKRKSSPTVYLFSTTLLITFNVIIYSLFSIFSFFYLMSYHYRNATFQNPLILPAKHTSFPHNSFWISYHTQLHLIFGEYKINVLIYTRCELSIKVRKYSK